MDRRKRVKEVLHSKEFCNELESVIKMESNMDKPIFSGDSACTSFLQINSANNTLQRTSKLRFYSGDKQTPSLPPTGAHFLNSANLRNLGVFFLIFFIFL